MPTPSPSQGQHQPHPDETRIVEDHAQTAHKLAVWGKYPGAWATIIANARAVRFNNRDLWVVDTHAGAGLHLSREHPDGIQPGTPILACYAARSVQQRNPGTRLHIRAIDIRAEYVQTLNTRVQPFRTAPEGPDRIDVEVYRSDFAAKVPDILRETEGGQCRSLWLVDPYGVAEIPHLGLEPLTVPPFGPEIVINLDVSGLWRVSAAGETTSSAEDITSSLTPAHVTSLQRTYGSDVWQAALRGFRPRSRAYDLFAQLYANTFPAFQYRNVYRLNSSGNQIRYFVHLAHSELAVTAFQKTFKSTQNVGLFQGRALSLPERAQLAVSYHETFAGTATTVDQLYESGRLPLDRGQIKVVCRAAEQDGYGKFDEPSRQIAWHDERLTPQLRLGMDA
jgi:three-Cys-motif partner protein